MKTWKHLSENVQSRILSIHCFFQNEMAWTNYVAFFNRYAKGYDPDNWLSIDETTGAITMNKAPDRESKFLVNGTYYAKIFSITQGKFHWWKVYGKNIFLLFVLDFCYYLIIYLYIIEQKSFNAFLIVYF